MEMDTSDTYHIFSTISSQLKPVLLSVNHKNRNNLCHRFCSSYRRKHTQMEHEQARQTNYNTRSGSGQTVNHATTHTEHNINFHVLKLTRLPIKWWVYIYKYVMYSLADIVVLFFSGFLSLFCFYDDCTLISPQFDHHNQSIRSLFSSIWFNFNHSQYCVILQEEKNCCDLCNIQNLHRKLIKCLLCSHRFDSCHNRSRVCLQPHFCRRIFMILLMRQLFLNRANKTYTDTGRSIGAMLIYAVIYSVTHK